MIIFKKMKVLLDSESIFNNFLNNVEDEQNSKKLNYLIKNLKARYRNNFFNCKFIISTTNTKNENYLNTSNKFLNIFCFKNKGDSINFENMYNYIYSLYLSKSEINNLNFYNQNYFLNCNKERIRVMFKKDRKPISKQLNDYTDSPTILNYLRNKKKLNSPSAQIKYAYFNIDKKTNILNLTENRDNQTVIIISRILTTEIKSCNIQITKKSSIYGKIIKKTKHTQKNSYDDTKDNFDPDMNKKCCIKFDLVNGNEFNICSNFVNQIQCEIEAKLMKYQLESNCDKNSFENFDSSKQMQIDPSIKKFDFNTEFLKNNVFVYCMNEKKVKSCICRNYPNSLICQEIYCQINPNNFECSRSHCDSEPSDIEACECKINPYSEGCKCKLDPYLVNCKKNLDNDKIVSKDSPITQSKIKGRGRKSKSLMNIDNVKKIFINKI